MAIVSNNFRAQVRDAIKAYELYNKALIGKFFTEVGIATINAAIDSRDYRDITGNFVNSYFFAIYQGGKLVEHFTSADEQFGLARPTMKTLLPGQRYYLYYYWGGIGARTRRNEARKRGEDTSPYDNDLEGYISGARKNMGFGKLYRGEGAYIAPKDSPSRKRAFGEQLADAFMSTYKPVSSATGGAFKTGYSAVFGAAVPYAEYQAVVKHHDSMQLVMNAIPSIINDAASKVANEFSKKFQAKTAKEAQKKYEDYIKQRYGQH